MHKRLVLRWNLLISLCLLGLLTQGSGQAACRGRGTDAPHDQPAAPTTDASRPAEDTSASNPAVAVGDEAMALPFSAVREGLSPQHLEPLPYWEQRFCTPPRERPGRTVCNIQRLYADGAYYTMPDDQPQEGAPRWNFLTTVRPEAFRELDRLFAENCGLDRPIPAGDGVFGELRVNAPSCAKVFQLSIGPTPFDEVQPIMYRHFETIPPDPSPGTAAGGADAP